MKKIDLHTHTICTPSDAHFVFCLETLKDYVTSSKIDCIAITNHNTFDRVQFESIRSSLDILVLPGIEIDLENGHILVISCDSDLENFCLETQNFEELFKSKHTISLAEFSKTIQNFDRRILIPHSDKNPEVPQEVISKLSNYIQCGEVSNPKKFIKFKKGTGYPTPVLFSDERFDSKKRGKFRSRCTYIDIGELNFNALKIALNDKTKVQLSSDEGKNLIDALRGDIKISSGLNVIIGKRASGKSHLLSELEYENDVPGESRVKYIKQFELQQIEDSNIDTEIKSNESIFTEEFLSPLKTISQKVLNIDIEANNSSVDKYITTLKQYAQHIERHDAFSKTIMFTESKFELIEHSETFELLNAVILLIENTKFSDIIEKNIEKTALQNLFFELLAVHWDYLKDLEIRKKCNQAIEYIQDSLSLKTAAPRVSEIKPVKVIMDEIYVQKFNSIVKRLRKPKVINRDEIQGFTKIFETAVFDNATDMKSVFSNRTKFTDVFPFFNEPYKFLMRCKEHLQLPDSDLYKILVKIKAKVLNRGGLEISGGERSEYMLLQKIKNSLEYDLVLIDEPESSFDNVFLNEKVNSLIRDISDHVPVVLVTHSATVGATINADFYLYTEMQIVDEKPEFKIYYGHPTDKVLRSSSGDSVRTHDALLNCFEAGHSAYNIRNRKYANLEN